MKQRTRVITVLWCALLVAPLEAALEPAAVPAAEEHVEQEEVSPEYTIGADDILTVNILQPEALSTTVSVSPDGSINVPYIGMVPVKGQSIVQVQETVRERLADGYMKYPVVSVTLQQSRSRKIFLYGEVVKPGTYPLDESTTVLRAISMAGGFTKFGSSSKVKVLRPRKGKPGYDTIKVNIKALMNGSSQEDIQLQSEDIVVVSEGVF